MVGLKHHDYGSDLGAVVEVDHVFIGHADAARRNRFANIFRLVGAVNPEQRVLAARVEIHGAGTHRVCRTRRHEFRHAHALDFAGGRMPGRPFGHAADLGDAGPGHRFLADGDAVANGLAAIHHVIKIVIVGIDHDAAGQFLAVVIDDSATERLANRDLLIGRLGKQFLVLRLKSSLVGRLILRHAGRDVAASQRKTGGQKPGCRGKLCQSHCNNSHSITKTSALARRSHEGRPRRFMP